MFGNVDLLGCAQPGDWKIYNINICDCEINKSQKCALEMKYKVSSNQRNQKEACVLQKVNISVYY